MKEQGKARRAARTGPTDPGQKAIVRGIEQGLADMRHGRLVDHKEALRRIKKTIRRAGKSRIRP